MNVNVQNKLPLGASLADIDSFTPNEQCLNGFNEIYYILF